MKNPPLDYPIQIMLDEQASLVRQLVQMKSKASLAPASLKAETEERLAACRVAQQILNLYAAYQTQPLATHEIPALPQ